MGGSITFRLSPDRYRDTAIFNLLKATIDGVSAVLFDAVPAGPRQRWSYEDWWIVALSAKKAIADGEPTVNLEIGSPNDHGASAVATPAADIDIPGSPPLWPGDARGQARVLQWREFAVERLASVRQSFRRDAKIGLHFGFRIEQSRLRTSDLDNFCIPAAQAVSYSLFGDGRRANILELAATKQVARPDSDVGTRVRVWVLE